MLALAFLVAISGLLGLNGGSAAAAQEYGQLDPTFGDGGKVTLDLGGKSEAGLSMVIQSDGKMIVVGADNDAAINAPQGFTLIRYNSDGSLDQSFGRKGVAAPVLLQDGANIELYENDIVLQPDGKIVAIGATYTATGDIYSQIVLARYNDNGALDQNFGDNGVVITKIAQTSWGGVAHTLALQPDGKIVLAGAADLPNNYLLIRYNSDGSLDDSFGSGGIALFADDAMTYVSSIALQPDGKIVLESASEYSDDHFDFTLWRFNGDGAVDTSFGYSGVVPVDFALNDDLPYGMVSTPDGKLILAGFTGLPRGAEDCADYCDKTTMALAQYNADGTLDTSFGSGGKVFADLETGPWFATFALARRVDGKLALAGQLDNKQFAVALYNADGSVDSRFGVNGIAVADFSDLENSATAIAFQADGSLVAAGRAGFGTDINTNYDFALARFMTPPVATSSNCPLGANDLDWLFLGKYLRQEICDSIAR